MWMVTSYICVNFPFSPWLNISLCYRHYSHTWQKKLRLGKVKWFALAGEWQSWNLNWGLLCKIFDLRTMKRKREGVREGFVQKKQRWHILNAYLVPKTLCTIFLNAPKNSWRPVLWADGWPGPGHKDKEIWVWLLALLLFQLCDPRHTAWVSEPQPLCCILVTNGTWMVLLSIKVCVVEPVARKNTSVLGPTHWNSISRT